MALIDELYSKGKADAIRTLWSGDELSAKQVMAEIGRELIRNKKTISSYSMDQLVLIFSSIDFDHEETEPVTVAAILRKYATQDNPIPMLTETIIESSLNKVPFADKVDFASKCLVSLSLFHSYMQERHRRYAYPEPDFYRNLGMFYFNATNNPEIADNFVNWETFVRKTFN
jgi:hypothetical protein